MYTPEEAVKYLQENHPDLATFLRPQDSSIQVIHLPHVSTLCNEKEGTLLVSETFLKRPLQEVAFGLARAVLLREYKSHARREDRNQLIWSIAMNHEVLGALQNLGFVIPSYFLNQSIQTALLGLPAEKVYDQLKTQPPSQSR